MAKCHGQGGWVKGLGQREREARASGLKEHQSCCLSWDGRKQYQINLGARYEESSVPWRLKIEAVEELERRGWKQTAKGCDILTLRSNAYEGSVNTRT